MKRYFPIGRLSEKSPAMTGLALNLQFLLSARSSASVGGNSTNCRKRPSKQSDCSVVTLPHFFVGFAPSISLTSVLVFLCYFTFPIFSLPRDIFVLSSILSSVKIIMGNRDMSPKITCLVEELRTIDNSMSTRTLSPFLSFKFCLLHHLRLNS